MARVVRNIQTQSYLHPIQSLNLSRLMTKPTKMIRAPSEDSDQNRRMPRLNS